MKHPLVYVGLLAFLCLYAYAASAQDGLQSSRPMGHFGVGHEQHHEWYRGLRNANNGSCCNGHDCRPTQARWNNVTNTYDVMVDGIWRTLTPKQSFAIITPEVLAKQGKERPDSQAHVCTSIDGKYIYCVLPPASGG